MAESGKQLRARFCEDSGALAPLELVQHVMSAYGWHTQTEEKLQRLGFGVTTEDVVFPASLWKASFESAGAKFIERGRAVHGLKIRHLPKPAAAKSAKRKAEEYVFEEYRFVGKKK